MKTVNNNGKLEVINETFSEALDTLNYYLEEGGAHPISEKEAAQDWGIVGGETNAQLMEWANDYLSECHSERCAEKRAYLYN